MLITAAQTALTAAGALGLTGLDVAHKERAAAPGSALQAGLAHSKSQIFHEAAGMGASALLLAKPVLSHLPGGGLIGRLVTPSVVTLAFAAGTAVDVVH